MTSPNSTSEATCLSDDEIPNAARLSQQLSTMARYACVCGVPFQNRQGLQKHIDETRSGSRCSCGAEFNNRAILHLHAEERDHVSYHAESVRTQPLVIEESADDEDEKTSATSDVASSSSDCDSALNMPSPSKAVPYQCSLCTRKPFGSAGALQDHVKDKHSDTLTPEAVKPSPPAAAVVHQCAFCTKETFGDAQALITHIKDKHTDVFARPSASVSSAPFKQQCNICRQNLICTAADLVRHIEQEHIARKATPGAPTSKPQTASQVHECRFCGRKRFASAQGLKDHMEALHPMTAKRAQQHAAASKASAASASNRSVAPASRANKGPVSKASAEAVNYRCQFCAKKPFSTADGLKAHINTKHGIKGTSAATGKWQCRHCRHGPFKSLLTLVVHIKSTHGATACELCPMRTAFGSHNALVQHRKASHADVSGSS